jgi:hypothetical protein
MCPHGNYPSSCQSCREAAGPAAAEKESAPRSKIELSAERLKEMNTLESIVEADISGLLGKLNADLGAKLQPREDGLHLTIMGPTETSALKTLTPERIDELQRINADIQQGIGVGVTGFGVIDGASRDNLRPADKKKKVAYMAFDIPALQKFRAEVGLPPKDFHVTLGFEEGDIHMEIVGKNDKGKDVLAPIPKKADPAMDGYRELLPQMAFGSLAGGEKEKKKVDPEAEQKKARKEAADAMKARLDAAGLGSKALIELGVKPGPDMGKILKAIEKAVAEGARLEGVPDDLRAELEKRVEAARGG